MFFGKRIIGLKADISIFLDTKRKITVLQN